MRASGGIVAAVVGLVVVVALGLAQGCARGSDVIATYKGGTITSEDLERRILSDPKTRRGPPRGTDRGTWEEQIVRRLVLEKVLVPQDRLVAREGSLVRPGLWRTVVVNALLEREGLRHVVVPDDSVRAYYDRHWADFYVPEGVVFEHVFLPMDIAGGEATARATAESVLALAKGGVEFGSLVQRYSRSESRAWGGRVGPLRRGELPGEIERILFALGPGEVGGPLRTTEGYHVFKVVERPPDRLAPFEEVAATIRQHLIDRELDAMKREYLAGLADEIPVRQFPDSFAGAHESATVVEVGEERVSKGELVAWLARFGKAGAGFEEARDLLEPWIVDARLFHRAKARGLTEDPVVVERFRSVRAGAIVDSVVASMVAHTRVPEATLRRHFEEHRVRFLSPKTWTVREIVVPFGEDRLAAWKRARSLADEAAKGADFALLARSHSVAPSAADGGFLGPLRLWDTGRKGPEFQKLVLSLREGEIGGPVRTDRGYLLVKVEGIEEPRERPFEEVVDEVRADYLSSREDSLTRAVTGKILRDARFRLRGSRG